MNMAHDLTLTLTEMVSILIFLLGLVSAWISLRVKITKIETSTNMKLASMESTSTLRFAAIESKLAEYIKNNNEQIKSFASDNKEEHRELMHDVKNIRSSINAIFMKIGPVDSKEQG